MQAPDVSGPLKLAELFKDAVTVFVRDAIVDVESTRITDPVKAPPAYGKPETVPKKAGIWA
jgi:hypothetical protein